MKGTGVLKTVCECENDTFRLIETFSHDYEYGWEGESQFQICTNCGKNLGVYLDTNDTGKTVEITREELQKLQHKE